ncbi:MAG: hypothetical protein JNL10_12085, partial [Verrucomicrobiales bacterium]|nr:hypothetical protein [Verrucomicrobiales bacterium]
MSPRIPSLVLGAGLAAAGAAGWGETAIAAASTGAGPGVRPRPQEPATFSGSVARILHQRCSSCHHEGQAAPFSLVSYADVKKHAKDIRTVVASRIMPPWLPEPGHGEFVGDRRLPDEERDVILNWLDGGAPEGDPAQAPTPPRWTSGWMLGTPDLVVTMEAPYLLGAEGPDVYRNFVIRLPLTEDRWVRAVEFLPGNPRVVHHAFLRLDEEGQARRMDGRDGVPGFTDMLSTVRMPAGQFLVWNPGAPPILSPPGLPWRLPRNSDLVVEMHLNRSGKPESLRSTVGFYFTDQPPTNTCQVFKLASYALDFPPGATREVVRDSVVLPVDVQVLAVYPHAHFLGKEMRGEAVRPDGTREPLISIREWNFNWQSAYRYARPIHLPKGTTLHLEYTYDNSTNNVLNPNHPPKRVTYGPQSSDEMCELGLQVLTQDATSARLLEEMAGRHRSQLIRRGYEHRVAADPNDAEALTRLGMMRWMENSSPEALALLERAVQAQPGLAEAHHNLGVVLRLSGRLPEARSEFET